MTDAPPIQYARTRDGVDIACWTLGDGPPFIYLPAFPFGHVGLEWANAERRALYEHWIERSKFVKYDSRGTALSGPATGPITLEDHFADLDAVMEKVGGETFALLGFLHFGRVALAYAASHPERISHVVLWCTYRQTSDWEGSANGRATRALIEADWHTYSETAPHLIAGWDEGVQGRRLANMVREGLTPEVTLAMLDGFAEMDITTSLAEVRCPVLILHRRDVLWPGTEIARDLAAHMPDARVAVLDGSSGGLHVGDTDSVFRAVDEFLGLKDVASDHKAGPSPIHTILFTDVAGSTALTEKLGDAPARALLREHERITRQILKEHHGTEIKTMGDGFMATFASATTALECAVAIQRALADTDLRVRIGLNSGEPIAEGADLFGTAVNVAARIAAEAKAGEILVSNVVRELVAGKGFMFADRGETALRGFEDPVRVYEVRWQP